MRQAAANAPARPMNIDTGQEGDGWRQGGWGRVGVDESDRFHLVLRVEIPICPDFTTSCSRSSFSSVRLSVCRSRSAHFRETCWKGVENVKGKNVVRERVKKKHIIMCSQCLVACRQMNGRITCQGGKLKWNLLLRMQESKTKDTHTHTNRSTF